MQATGPYGTATEICVLIMKVLPINATKYGSYELNRSKVMSLLKKAASPKHL